MVKVLIKYRAVGTSSEGYEGFCDDTIVAEEDREKLERAVRESGGKLTGHLCGFNVTYEVEFEFECSLPNMGSVKKLIISLPKSITLYTPAGEAETELQGVEVKVD